MDSQELRKWEEIRADWGRRLLKEYPKGLGKFPNFEEDFMEREKWFTVAIKEYPKQSYALVNRWEIQIDGKTKYTEIPKSPVDKVKLATKAFQEADALWTEAKKEHDARMAEEKSRQEAEAAKVKAEQDAKEALQGDLANYKKHIESMGFLQLDFERDKLRDEKQKPLSPHTLNHITAKIEIVEKKMLEIDRWDKFKGKMQKAATWVWRVVSFPFKGG